MYKFIFRNKNKKTLTFSPEISDVFKLKARKFHFLKYKAFFIVFFFTLRAWKVPF